MKRENSSVLALAFLVLSLLAPDAHSDPSEACPNPTELTGVSLLDLPPAVDNFCQLPFVSLCADLKTNSGARASRIAAEQAKLQREAAEKALLKYGYSTKGMNYLTLTALVLKTGGKVVTEYLRNYDAALMLKFTKNEIKNLYSNFAKVRGYIEEAVDEEARWGALSYDAAKAMKDRLKKTAIFPHFSIELFKGSSDALIADIYQSYVTFCGNGYDHNLAENAFASQIRGQPYIIMCPGKVLAAVGSGENSKRALQTLLSTLAHEFGHQIDAEHFPKEYARLEKCLIRHHADGLRLNPATTSSLGLLGSAAIRTGKVVSNLREIGADYWAARAQSKYLASLPLEQRHEALRDGYGKQCGQMGSDTGTLKNGLSHPPGLWRYEVMIRRNEEISKLMECPVAGTHSSAKPGCALSGETEDLLF